MQEIPRAIEVKNKKKTRTIILILVLVGFFFLVFFYSVFSIFTNMDNGGFSKPDIAVIEVNDVIIESKKIVKDLKKYEEKDSIKAIILKINSPGGAVGATQEIYDEVKRIKKKKKIVASFESVAASGGYYIACPAHKIVANPGTLTGSIGVILNLFNIQDVLKWAKIKKTVIKSGKFKDIGSATKEMTTAERKLLQTLSDNIHDQFKKAVSESRNIPLKKLNKIADGRILTGEQAKKHGLIDELGNISKAIEIAKDLAGIKGKPNVYYPKKKSEDIWELILDSKIAKKLFEGFADKVTASVTDEKEYGAYY